MTLDEAIERSIRIAEKNEELHKTTHPAFRLFDYEKCAKESRQLAEWLFELKDLREQKDTLNKIRAEIGMYEADCRLQGGTDECGKCNSNVFGSIYRIIDKYKAESEENNGNG